MSELTNKSRVVVILAAVVIWRPTREREGPEAGHKIFLVISRHFIFVLLCCSQNSNFSYI